MTKFHPLRAHIPINKTLTAILNLNLIIKILSNLYKTIGISKNTQLINSLFRIIDYVLLVFNKFLKNFSNNLIYTIKVKKKKIKNNKD